MAPETKKKEGMPLFLLVYTFGLAGGVLFYSLVLLRKIKVRNFENLFKIKSGSLIICNHPSLFEPLLVGFLFALQYLRHPYAHRPWSTPDSINFYINRWFWPFRRVSIPIIRKGNVISNREVLRYILQIARGGNGDLILFPEGGRTPTAEKEGRIVYSGQGKKLGTINETVGNLATRFKQILPIWVEGTDKFFPNNQITDKALKKGWSLPLHYLMAFVRLLFSRKDKVVITIGEPFKIPEGVSGEEASRLITEILLKLADQ